MIYSDEAAMMQDAFGDAWPAYLFDLHEICEQRYAELTGLVKEA